MRKAHVDKLKRMVYGLVMADVLDDNIGKVAYIRLHRLNESSLVHELLHIKYPHYEEDKITKLTLEICIKNPEILKWR